MHHWKEIRVKGHVYLCVLAYFVIAAFEYLSKEKGVTMSARKILRSLSEIKLIQIELPAEIELVSGVLAVVHYRALTE